MKYNPERGEVLVDIKGKQIVIANEFERLAQLTTELDARSFMEVFSRLNNADPAALLIALRVMTIRGDFDVLKSVLHGSRDLPTVQQAVMKAMAFGLEPDEGEAEAVEGKTKD